MIRCHDYNSLICIILIVWNHLDIIFENNIQFSVQNFSFSMHLTSDAYNMSQPSICVTLIYLKFGLAVEKMAK